MTQLFILSVSVASGVVNHHLEEWVYPASSVLITI